jgi:hypothetical protein
MRWRAYSVSKFIEAVLIIRKNEFNRRDTESTEPFFGYPGLKLTPLCSLSLGGEDLPSNSGQKEAVWNIQTVS